MTSEFDRRRQVIAEGQTDYERWLDVRQLEQAWDQRASVAADLIPAGASVLDLGCGRMALERLLPPACTYVPCDLVARDPRTLVCDFNAGQFPEAASATHITVLGVLEYIYDLPAFLRRLRACGRPAVLSYNPTDFTRHLNRTSLGWVNHLSLGELERALEEAGLSITLRLMIDQSQILLRLAPERPLKVPSCRVLVVSAHHVGNFGDRLGYHLINEVLPAYATVHHAIVNFGLNCARSRAGRQLRPHHSRLWQQRFQQDDQ